MTELFIRKSIETSASAEALWKVLTENEFIEQYMFGCMADTDWKPGSPLLWKGAADGKLYVKGHIVASGCTSPARIHGHRPEQSCGSRHTRQLPDYDL